MDPNQPAAGERLQNTSPSVDPAEYAHLQEVIVHQGAIIARELSYQNQLAALQAAAMFQQQAPPASMTVSTHGSAGEV